jgi:O-antigen ligase
MKKFILFLAFFLPFQFALNPTPGVDLAIARLLIILAFFIWFISGLIKKCIKISNNYITHGLLLFLLFALLSIIKAEEINWAIRKLLVFISIFPLYLVVADTFKRKFFLKISKAFVYSSFGVSLLGVFQFISQFVWGKDAIFDFWSKYLAGFFLGSTFSQSVIALPSWWVNISGHTILRATSLFPDPHMLAFFLGMTLPFSIALLNIKKRSKKYYIFYGSIALINLACLILTFSRGGYIGLLVAGLWLLATGYWSLDSGCWKKKRKYIILSVSALVLSAILVVAITPVRTRLLSSFDLTEGSVAGRIEIWQQAFSVWVKNLWLGVGIGNYPYHLNPLFDYRLPVYAHNTYLDIAVEMGIFALLSWISVFAYTIYKLFKNQRSKGRIQNIVLSASLIYFLAHSFFDTPIYSPRILPLLIIVLAISSVMINKNKQ